MRVLAITAARNENAATQPAAPFGDVPEVSSVRIEAPRRAFVDAIDVRLSSPNPGAVIRCTFDGSEPTEEAAIYQGPFSITATTTVRARAFVEGMDDRFAAAATFTKLVPREPHAAGGLQSGLACRYYEGAWERLPDFSALAPLRSVIAGQLEVPEFARAEDIGMEFSGYLSVPADGVYTFHLWSDDGSAMDLGGERLIDNDGLHGSREQWADVALRAGAHPVAITYFQHLGGAALELWVEGPGIDLRRVPQEWWGHVAGER
ncbi:MAG: chitobiase/beta-hexosaminidase C-terminal domain-containing protein [Gemmatimonadetes bacterium]|nr:chitobiase/beta-hexosaminidase C-terminal domain-containing protein [Gemmatimonadota bacterium]